MHVLCGIDDSAVGRHAAHVAARLAAQRGGELVLLHALALPGSPRVPPGVTARRAAAGRQVLDEIADEVARSSGAEVTRELKFGPYADVLRAASQDPACDLLVVGHKRRGRIARALRRTTHDGLTQTAACPVMAVSADDALPTGPTPGRRRPAQKGAGIARLER